MYVWSVVLALCIYLSCVHKWTKNIGTNCIAFGALCARSLNMYLFFLRPHQGSVFPCMLCWCFVFAWLWFEVLYAHHNEPLSADRGGWAAGKTCSDKSHLFWRREPDAWTEAWPRGEGRRPDKRGEKGGGKLRLRLLTLPLFSLLFLWPLCAQEATVAKLHAWVIS